MMGLLLQRRKLMIPTASVPFVPQKIYGLYDRTVVANDYIETGVAPFANGVSTTILLDINITSNPTSTSSAYRYRLIYVRNAAGTGHEFSVYKPSQWSNSLRARLLSGTDSDNAGKIGSSSAGRKRILITHGAKDNEAVGYGKDGSGTLTQKILSPSTTSGNYVPSSSQMTLGLPTVSYGLPPAIINKCEVYNYVFSQAEIDSFFADE